MALHNERDAHVIWSGIAEPGDAWGGALRRQMGVQHSLEWVSKPFVVPPVGPPNADGTTNVVGAWAKLHGRYQQRLETVEVEKAYRELDRLGGHLVLPSDSQWPQGFSALMDTEPPALWVMGAQLDSVVQPTSAIALVGARGATSYGVQTASQLAFDLRNGGYTIVSGGAYGIDTAAHSASLQAAVNLADSVVPTVAVICGGLANLYPPGNRKLFRSIVEQGGAIVAESPPHFRPARWRFLERNRMIAAWASVTVVVEATPRSGALATANRALELGREVAAVPGPVSAVTSAGPNNLLKDGAAVADSAIAIAELVEGPQSQVAVISDSTDTWLRDRLRSLGPVSERTWEAMPKVGSAIPESVARAAGLTAEEVGAALVGLQLAGLATMQEGKWRRSSIEV